MPFPIRVTLLESTKDPERVVALAARICYSDRSVDQIGRGLTGAGIEKLLNRIMAMGHMSVLEHAVFTFGVEGVSRVTSHQLVRHRLASYSQKSQRYVPESKMGEVVVPPSIDDLTLRETFLKAAEKTVKTYHELLAAGVVPEDARYLLPSGTTTSLVMTMNARELHHFFSLRCCNRAQWEIRKVAIEVLRRCLKAAPLLFSKSGPGCLRGPCPEGEFSCQKTAEVRKFFAGLKSFEADNGNE